LRPLDQSDDRFIAAGSILGSCGNRDDCAKLRLMQVASPAHNANLVAYVRLRDRPRPELPLEKSHDHFGVQSRIAGVTNHLYFVDQASLGIDGYVAKDFAAPTFPQCNHRNKWVGLVNYIGLPIRFYLLGRSWPDAEMSDEDDKKGDKFFHGEAIKSGPIIR
jgi:hypothetical protein